MGATVYLFMVIFALIVGQIIYNNMKHRSTFYIIHLIVIVLLSVWAYVVGTSATGDGASFPWTLLLLFYGLPAFISMLIGGIRDLIWLHRNNRTA